uniref:Uncharacterized protein At5g66950 n=1 Tax=Arabidopsis thaliana TaxID=3702 RepID=Q93XZ1_ARATH|nr:Unknown protein [Arabidopsis thaliana]AAN15477.1 Unknown protein [Arabidopsis thaliana]
MNLSSGKLLNKHLKMGYSLNLKTWKKKMSLKIKFLDGLDHLLDSMLNESSCVLHHSQLKEHLNQKKLYLSLKKHLPFF